MLTKPDAKHAGIRACVMRNAKVVKGKNRNYSQYVRQHITRVNKPFKRYRTCVDTYAAQPVCIYECRITMRSSKFEARSAPILHM
jgi:hypothetical protein